MMMNETYYINAIPGACGNFIIILLQSLLEKNILGTFEFPNGNAHNLIDKKINVSGLYSYAHTEPDWEKIRNTDSNKNIIITVSKNMHHRIQANFYFKNIVPGSTPEYIRNYWESYPYVTDRLLGCDIPNIPNEELDLVFSNNIKRMNSVNYPFNDSDVMPYGVEDKINILKLHDIIHNKNIILEKLSEITQQPITDHIHQTYDNYLIAQKKLIPWLDDSEYIK